MGEIKEFEYRIPRYIITEYLEDPSHKRFGEKRGRILEMTYIGSFVSILLLLFTLAFLSKLGIHNIGDAALVIPLFLSLLGFMIFRRGVDKTRLDTYKLKGLINDEEVLFFNFNLKTEKQREAYLKANERSRIQIFRRYSSRFIFSNKMIKLFAISNFSNQVLPRYIFKRGKNPSSSMIRLYESLEERGIAFKDETGDYCLKKWKFVIEGDEQKKYQKFLSKIFGLSHDINQEQIEHLWSSLLYFEYRDIVPTNYLRRLLFGI